MTEDTFDEMDPIMGNRANINPPLIINQRFMGYEDSSDSTLVRDDDDSNDTDHDESVQRGKKKRKIRSSDSNELLAMLKQKWADNKEADAIASERERTASERDKAARERQLDIMQKNTDACSSVAESLKIIAEKMK